MEYRFYLRRGLRWSDGVPFTADDILFWYEDLFRDEENRFDAPEWAESGLKVVKNDDYTVTFQLSKSDSQILEYLAGPYGDNPTRFARHYFKRFLPKYNPDANRLARAEGFPSWKEKLRDRLAWSPRYSYLTAPGPSLNGWIYSTDRFTSEGKRTLVLKRHPYYWHIDSAGNQLPYIDTIEFFEADNQ
jgi:peptide/nickel transport system substrate-binding protein